MMFFRRRLSCAAVRADLVAWLDAALPARLERRLRGHIEACADCAAAAAALRTAIRQQTEMLRGTEAGVAVDVDRMWARVRVAVAAGDAQRPAAGSWLWRPVFAVVIPLIVVVAGVSALGGPETVLITTGIQEPPKKLAKKAELFAEYPIIEELDVLEQFDTADIDPALVTPGAHQG